MEANKAERNMNELGKEIIRELEGFRTKAYLDTGGVWTIGYGTTRIQGKPVEKGDECTKEQAEEYLSADLKWAEDCVNKNVKPSLTSNQFSALVSFVYNIGCEGFTDSTMLKLLNENKFALAANEFKRWNKDNGKVILGLINRRNKERALFDL